MKLQLTDIPYGLCRFKSAKMIVPYNKNMGVDLWDKWRVALHYSLRLSVTVISGGKNVSGG